MSISQFGGLLITHLTNLFALRRNTMFIAGLGAVFFGLIIGWISYRVMRLAGGTNGIWAIAIFIASLARAAVIALLRSESLFPWFAIVLLVAFFACCHMLLVIYSLSE